MCLCVVFVDHCVMFSVFFPCGCCVFVCALFHVLVGAVCDLLCGCLCLCVMLCVCVCCFFVDEMCVFVFCSCFTVWDVVRFVFIRVFVFVCECFCGLMRFCVLFVMYCVILYLFFPCALSVFVWYCFKCVCALCL